ncbi:3820_t:CDS:2, partial [Dentiscutata heterogama]
PVLDKNFKTDKSKQNLEAILLVPFMFTPTMEIPKKNSQKKKVSLELKIKQEKNENKDDMLSNNLPDSVGTFDTSST